MILKHHRESLIFNFLNYATSMLAWLNWGFWVSPISYGEIGISLNELNCLCAVYYLHHLPIADGWVRTLSSLDHIELISAVFYLLILLLNQILT